MTDNHWKHSVAVKSWQAKEAINWMTVMDWKEDEHEYFTLKSPEKGYRVSVTFSKYKDHPEYIRIRSTNWRCEDEPSGIFRIEDAREFYIKLKKAGLILEEQDHMEPIAS